MRLHEVSRVWQDGQVRLVGRVTRDGEPEPAEIYFSYPEELSGWILTQNSTGF